MRLLAAPLRIETRFAPRDRWSFRLGATLKVRSAEIGLTGDPGRSVKEDTLLALSMSIAFLHYRLLNAS